MFQHTAARRRLGLGGRCWRWHDLVSTHSRPKAAGSTTGFTLCDAEGFNTQPPEGGWMAWQTAWLGWITFQHTAARRRLDPTVDERSAAYWFQHTAARRRLAAMSGRSECIMWFQHTAARRRLGNSTSRLCAWILFQHTAARRRLVAAPRDLRVIVGFQHTAARRRLEPPPPPRRAKR